MPLSTDITLPREYKPRFPDRCLVCHGKPDSTLLIPKQDRLGGLSALIPALGGPRIEIPLCKSCKPRFRIQRVVRTISNTVGILGVMFLVGFSFPSWQRMTRNLAGLGAGVLAAVVASLIETVWPRFFDTTGRSDSIDYEFESTRYAAEFLSLNEEAVIRSDFTE